MNNYIKLFRKCTENFLFDEKPFDRWHAFEFLMIRASWKPKTIIIKGQQVKLDAGQLIYSEATLAKCFGWSREKVRRFITLLESLEMITTKPTYLGTIITVTNWQKYQQNETADETTESIENYTFIGSGHTADRTSNETADETTDETADETADETQKKKEKKEKKEKNEKNIPIGAQNTDWFFLNVSDELSESVNRWLAYKAERNQSYKPIGLNTLLKRIDEKSKVYGDAAITEIIDDAIANRYQGIVWDKLNKQHKANSYDMIRGWAND